MKKLTEKQKRYFYLGVTLFVSLSLVIIVSNFFTQAAVIFTLIGHIFGALASVWIGLIIAYLMNPIVKFFESKVFSKLLKGKHKGGARALSVLVSLILLLAVLIGLLVLVIPQLINTIVMLVKNAPAYYRTVQSWGRSLGESIPIIADPLNNFLDNGYDKLIHWLQNDLLPSANVLGTVTSSLMSAATVIVDFFVGVIISIYLLCDRENFIAQSKKLLAAIFSEKWYTRIMTIGSETHHVFGEFITGKLFDSLFVGIVTFLFMWIADIPYATLVAVLVAVCNLIPFFGQFIGIIPSALLILVIDPVKALIFVVLGEGIALYGLLISILIISNVSK